MINIKLNDNIDLPKLSSLSIGKTSFGNSNNFLLSNLGKLISITIGDECFKPLSTFNLNGLGSLVTLTIGSNSFTEHPYSFGNDASKSFHILNCNKLDKVTLGQYSFSDYGGEFELNNLPELQRLQIGYKNAYSYNFYALSVLNLMGKLLLLYLLFRPS